MKTNARIYIMRGDDGALKLGHSRNPEARAKQIGRPVKVVHQTDVIEHAERIERLAHRVLALHGKHIRGEWFEATLEDAIAAIETATRQAEGSELPLGGALARHKRGVGAPQSLFSMRTDSAEGKEFLDALDELRAAERPQLDRTSMVKKLVFEAHRRVKGKR